MLNNNCSYISVRKLDYYVNNPNSIIIDLREKEDYRKAHVKNAVNIPYNEMKNKIKELKQKNAWFYRRNRYLQIEDKIYNDSYIYVFYCERGATSTSVCMQMSGLGFISKSVIGGFNNYNGKFVVTG